VATVARPKKKAPRAAKPKKAALDEPVLVRLTSAQKEQFETEATRMGLNLSAWIRMVLIKHLEPKSHTTGAG
jgi:hypothetical protein